MILILHFISSTLADIWKGRKEERERETGENLSSHDNCCLSTWQTKTVFFPKTKTKCGEE